MDYGLPGATQINVKWGWDDTATSGANTRDGCSLFDTDGDGFANYAFCVTVLANGTSIDDGVRLHGGQPIGSLCRTDAR